MTTTEPMPLSVAENRASKARKMLAFLRADAAAAGWEPQAIASCRDRFTASLREAEQVIGEHWHGVRVARGWHAANNGVGARIWFVTRETETGQEFLDRTDGRLVRFATHETAQRRADQLNRPA